MAWFRRREADDLPQTPPPDPDPVLPVLSREDAARLVALTRHTFAEHGRETVPDGQGALVGQGHVHGLSNLAATVSLVPRREWPGLVRRHVATMLQAHETEEPAVPWVVGDELGDAGDEQAGQRFSPTRSHNRRITWSSSAPTAAVSSAR